MTTDFHHRELVRVLKDMFGALLESGLEDIVPHFTWLQVAHDEVLLGPGEDFGDLFIVIEGRFLKV